MLKALVEKYVSSWTAKFATAFAGAGVAVTFDPTVLEYIPQQYRGPALTVVGILFLVARLRKELGL